MVAGRLISSILLLLAILVSSFDITPLVSSAASPDSSGEKLPPLKIKHGVSTLCLYEEGSRGVATPYKASQNYVLLVFKMDVWKGNTCEWEFFESIALFCQAFLIFHNRFLSGLAPRAMQLERALVSDGWCYASFTTNFNTSYIQDTLNCIGPDFSSGLTCHKKGAGWLARQIKKYGIPREGSP